MWSHSLSAIQILCEPPQTPPGGITEANVVVCADALNFMLTP